MASTCAHLLAVDLPCHLLLDLPHARQHAQQVLERPHLLDGLELLAEVLEREIVVEDLLFELGGVFLRDDRLGLLDERQHVAHAQHARHHPIGMERLEVVEALAAAREGDRHADDRDHRQRRAAARVAVHLRQHDAGDPTRRLNSPALLIASCPVIASATYSWSVGCTAALIASSSTISSSSMCRRPAVSTMTVS